MTMCSHCRQPVARIWGRLMCVNRNCPGEMLTALLAERDALKQTLHDELDANLRLRDLGGAKPDEPMTPFIERVIAERDALAAKLAQARGALAVCERAADMLTAYAELIRRDGASRIDQHHYLPEVEHVAQTLREASPPPALFVPDDAALAQEPAHTDHPARHFDRTCPACAQADILFERPVGRPEPERDHGGMTYWWLVENFTPEGYSTGLYMKCQVNMTLTGDVNKARKFRHQRTAEFRALDMREARRGDWRAVEHGFDDSKTPNARIEPGAN